MTNGLVIKKSPIGKEDVFFGRRVQQQERAGGLYDISGIVLVYPVKTMDELKNLDPKQYDTAFIVGSGVINTTPPGQPTILNGNNEFYYFDFTADEPEDIPNIIVSSVSLVGRWKVAKVGEGRIVQVVTEKVDEATKTVVDDVMTKVEEFVQSEILTAVENELVEVARDGGTYKPNSEYRQGDTVKVLQRTDVGIQLKEFMVKAKSPITQKPPLDDSGSETYGEAKIYAKDAEIDELNYQELLAPKRETKSFNVSPEKNYNIITGGAIPRGRLRVTTYKSGLITGALTINFAGTSLEDFSFSDVIYSQSIRQTAVVSSLGYIFYTGWAIYATSQEFGFAVKSTNQCDKIELDYSDLNLVPVVPQGTSFDSDSCYAPRQGGGSYIPNIGQTFYSMRQPGNSISGDSEDFYNFMSGSIPWVHAMIVDSSLYHQYVASCVLPDQDNNGKFIRNMGNDSAGVIGILQDESLPNIYNDGSVLVEVSQSIAGRPTGVINLLGSYNNPVSMGYSMLPDDSPFHITYTRGLKTFVDNAGSYYEAGSEVISKDLWVPLLGFDASRNNTTYQNGAKVKPDCMTRQDRLQLF